MISFSVTSSERFFIQKIGERAMKMRGVGGVYVDPLDVELDVIATHSNGNPLQLAKLADADDFQFAHDIFGIARHLNRKTGRLENCFLPRYSK